MNWEQKSGSGAVEAFSAAKTAFGQPAEEGAEQAAGGSSPLDFQSVEFNQTDDLDDNIGNFRVFQSLDGIVTADMRHQAERKRRRKSSGGKPEQLRPQAEKGESGTKATEREEDILPVTVVSKGRALIIDTDPDRAAACGEGLRARGLSCTLCITGGDSEVSLPRIEALPLIAVDSVSVSGGFGGFKTTTPGADGQADLAGSFDLVLDLQVEPSFVGEQLPLGYYAPGEDGARLDEALTELPEMRGSFQKPRFALLHNSRCLHGLSRSRECQRCLEICPVAAISSEKGKISIDPYLCQGCGGCALTCPAEAIRMLHPPPEELQTELRDAIADFLAAGDGRPPELIFFDRQIDRKVLLGMSGAPERGRVYYGVEEIGRIGLEMPLAALAYGAGSVSLVCDRTRPEALRKELERQVQLGGEILLGLGLPADRIRFVIHSAGQFEPAGGGLPTPVLQTSSPEVRPATFPPAQDRRTLTRLATQHLSETTGSNQPLIPLPEGAPFGGVAIEATACSLCMACAGVCPTGALAASGETPRLSFVESRCHQCGLCVAACPENAVRLLPRLHDNLSAAESPSVLREMEPFKCIECGLPFASMAMIDRMQEKLIGHWMYQSDRQMRRLRMCRTCRTRDALMAKDY